jgi:hypothetical protein
MSQLKLPYHQRDGKKSFGFGSIDGARRSGPEIGPTRGPEAGLTWSPADGCGHQVRAFGPFLDPDVAPEEIALSILAEIVVRRTAQRRPK